MEHMRRVNDSAESIAVPRPSTRRESFSGEHSHDSGCYVLTSRTGLSSPLFNEDDN